MAVRRIVREDWYWPTIARLAENRFRKRETKADLLLELYLRSRLCCEYFGKDRFACEACFALKMPCCRSDGVQGARCIPVAQEKHK